MKQFKEYKEEKQRLAEEHKGKENALGDLLETLLGVSTLNISSPVTDKEWTVNKDTTGYSQIKLGIQKRMLEARELKENEAVPEFSDFHTDKMAGLEYLTESENLEVDRWVQIWEDDYGTDPMDEGFLSKLVGGVGGFLIGPTVGRVIAHALGIKKGILYDMLTSKLVSASLGVALAKHFGGEYKK